MQSIHEPTPARKRALPTDPKEAPEELKQHNRWMGTKQKPRADGKTDKPPHRVRSGLPIVKADKTNPENWASFEEAYDAWQRGLVDAIGFVNTDQDEFTFIDKDDVLDPETGEIDADAYQLVENFPTYWEISLSGRGLHGICIADKPGTRCRTGNTEIYDGHPGARFVVITGNRLDEGADVRECQNQVNDLYNSLFPSEANKANRGRRDDRPQSHDLPMLEGLFEQARKSKLGWKFRQLFDQGDTSAYRSPSDADYALINQLIFWCAGDRELVVKAFKQSTLYRPPPEKHRRYVELSVDNALASYSGSYYRPRAVREKSTPEQCDVLAPYLAPLLDASRWKGQRAASGYKAYAALVILSIQDGIATATKELRIGADVRKIAEVAGMNRVTLCRSALPYLIEKKRITWKRGRGAKAGEFILRKPEVPSEATIKESTHFSGSTYGDGLCALSRLIRMRTGVSKTGRVTALGEMETVARLGMVAMFGVITLITSPRGLNIGEVGERMGRRKDHVRSAMRKLIAAEIVEESSPDFFTLAPAFWLAYDRALLKSGVVSAERRQRKQHQEERRKNEEKLKRGREKARQKADPRVIDLAGRRRRKLDRAAALRQMNERDMTPEQLQDLMQEEYDRMCERVQERLARREAERCSGGGVP